MRSTGLCFRWCIVTLLLLLFLRNTAHGLPRNASAQLHLRFISYENPGGILISGVKCDSGSSPCDPAFDVTVLWSGPDFHLSSPCAKNVDRIDFPSGEIPSLTTAVTSADGNPPTWAMVLITVRDCLLSESQDMIAQFQLNITDQAGQNSLLSNNASAALTYEMKSIRATPKSIKLTISLWAQCSTGFYGEKCEKYCETEDCWAKLGWGPTSTTKTVGPRAPRALGQTTPDGRDANKDPDASVREQTSIMFAAVMASSVTSILFLAIIALVAIRMCKASESNAIIMHRMASQDGTSDDLQQRHQQHSQQHHQRFMQHGYFNPASYNSLTLGDGTSATATSTSEPTGCSNRADSGVYEEPPEPPMTAGSSGEVADGKTPPPLPAREQQPQLREEVQRMPHSKSYSKKTT